MKKMLHTTNHQRNSNQNHSEMSPHPLGQPLLKRQKVTDAGEDVGKQNLCVSLA
jgi:hypothetical protein